MQLYKFNKKEYEIVSSVEDVSVELYCKLAKFWIRINNRNKKDGLDNLDLNISDKVNLLNVITNIPLTELKKVSVDEFVILFNKLNFVIQIDQYLSNDFNPSFEIEFEGVYYEIYDHILNTYLLQFMDLDFLHKQIIDDTTNLILWDLVPTIFTTMLLERKQIEIEDIKKVEIKKPNRLLNIFKKKKVETFEEIKVKTKVQTYEEAKQTFNDRLEVMKRIPIIKTFPLINFFLFNSQKYQESLKTSTKNNLKIIQMTAKASLCQLQIQVKSGAHGGNYFTRLINTITKPLITRYLDQQQNGLT